MAEKFDNLSVEEIDIISEAIPINTKSYCLGVFPFSKVSQDHPSISTEDVKKCYETKTFGDETPLRLLRVNSSRRIRSADIQI